jgi:hypothetical protein
VTAFLTGSRAYGTPRPDSDIDLCVLMSKEDLNELIAGNTPAKSDYGKASASLRFGILNLVCMTSEFDFMAWKVATEELIARKPVTKAEAIQTINECIAIAQDERLLAEA